MTSVKEFSWTDGVLRLIQATGRSATLTGIESIASARSLSRSNSAIATTYPATVTPPITGWVLTVSHMSTAARTCRRCSNAHTKRKKNKNVQTVGNWKAYVESMKNGFIRNSKSSQGLRISGRTSVTAQIVPSIAVVIISTIDQLPNSSKRKAPAMYGTKPYGKVAA